MTSDTIISVENVGKRYSLIHKPTAKSYTTLREVNCPTGRNVI
jgi:hypothetical protein